MGFKFEGSRDLPISPTIVPQLAMGTITSITDAIVEVVTNADDSYRRLEDDGRKTEGRIKIYVHRMKGGKCKELTVLDCAEGMIKEKLQAALEFAGQTSGFEEGRSVRGLFGRGLKEAIVVLGEAKIYTIKEDN